MEQEPTRKPAHPKTLRHPPNIIRHLLFSLGIFGLGLIAVTTGNEPGYQPDRELQIENSAKHRNGPERGRRRFKTVDGTSFRCEQRAERLLLNGCSLTSVRVLKDGMVHLQTDDQQFRIDGATYREMLFGNEVPTSMW